MSCCVCCHALKGPHYYHAAGKLWHVARPTQCLQMASTPLSNWSYPHHTHQEAVDCARFAGPWIHVRPLHAVRSTVAYTWLTRGGSSLPTWCSTSQLVSLVVMPRQCHTRLTTTNVVVTGSMESAEHQSWLATGLQLASVHSLML
jgi:hypothetical protein